MKIFHLVIRPQHALTLVLFTLLLMGPAIPATAGINFNDSLIKGPVLSEEEAIIVATTDMEKTDDGFSLKHRHFTACFTHDGVEVLPGRGGPDWHWRLKYAGTEKIPLLAVNQGRVSPAGDVRKRMVHYERGPIVEQYLARRRGMEQQFVISRPLNLNGADLVIEGSIESAGVFEKHADGWLWCSKEGVVSLGDVSVHDAKGGKIPAAMTVNATETRIVVEGGALAHAVYPVTIDPEVGANDFRISDMGPDGNTSYEAYYPSVAYNSAGNEYLVVWWGDDNTGSLVENEYEIFGQRINAATGAAVGANDVRISDMGPDGNTSYGAYDPAVAYNSAGNEYLVVWWGDDNTGSLVMGEYEIFGQRINAATGAAVGANDFRISDMGPDGNTSYDASVPDVAYNSAGNEYLVVWCGDDNTGSLVEGEWEIFGQRWKSPTIISIINSLLLGE